MLYVQMSISQLICGFSNVSITPRNIEELRDQIDNPHQRAALDKLILRHEKDQIYLVKYEENSRKNVKGVVTVMGAINSKGYRDQYDIRLYDNGSFWCSCPDHKFNSTKKNMVCKHICFIVCKVAKLLDVSFFETKKLDEQQFRIVMEKLSDTQKLYSDLSICRPPPDVTQDYFRNHKKVLGQDDMCPICYDDFMGNIQYLSCPACLNCVHEECMKVWLERQNTCVYCRSDIWKLF